MENKMKKYKKVRPITYVIGIPFFFLLGWFLADVLRYMGVLG